MLLPLEEDDPLFQPQSQPQPPGQASGAQQAAPQSSALLLFDEEETAPAASSSAEPYAKPPPPPPPPKGGDLDEVWTPLQDSSIQGCLVKEKTGELLLGTDAAMAAVLFGVDAPLREEEKKKQEAARGVNLLDLDDSGLPPATTKDETEGRTVGLMAEVPDYVAQTLEEKKKGRTMLDLSDPAERAAEEARQREKEQRRASSGGASSSTAPPSKAIPSDAKGFGSDDLFGKRPEDRQIHEQVRDEGINAYNTVKAFLPENVQSQMPSCTNPTTADEETELVISPGGGAGGAPAPVRPPDGSLEAEHENIAVNRAMEGRWVPTYMREQLAANGHTVMPDRPNGHEFNASAPPPSLTDALGDMAGDLGETAQTVFEFFASLLSTFTVQCQVCSVQSVSDVHEHVLTYGENLCRGGQADASTELVLGRPADESMAGLGPMRSRVQRTLLGVSFADLTLLVKTKLVTGVMPLSLSQVVKSREVTSTAVQHLPAVEDYLLATELNTEAVPEQFVQILCKRPETPMERVALKCQESWHVLLDEGKAMVEMTTAPSGGSVVITVRMDISALPQGQGCSIESRVYAKPRAFGEVLPVGFVDALTTSHNIYAEALHSVVMSVVQAGPMHPWTAGHGAASTAAAGAAAGTMAHMQESRPAAGGSCASEVFAPRSQGSAQETGSADANLMLKVANAI